MFSYPVYPGVGADEGLLGVVDSNGIPKERRMGMGEVYENPVLVEPFNELVAFTGEPLFSGQITEGARGCSKHRIGQVHEGHPGEGLVELVKEIVGGFLKAVASLDSQQTDMVIIFELEV